MKTEGRLSRYVFAVMLACMLLCFAALAYVLFGHGNKTAYAAESKNPGRTFYYDELKNSKLAQKFYGVLEDMAENGSFDTASSAYDLKDVLTQAQIGDYVVNGTPTIPVAFGAARDSFYMDHPELFYLDVYKIAFTAGMKDGEYVAYIDAGNSENYFVDNTVTEATLAKAQSDFASAVDAAVAAAKDGNGDMIAQIEKVNAYISERTSYDLGAVASSVGGGVVYNGNVYNAYGALVDGKAVCSGYTRAFKAVMDKLGIPCVMIHGSANNGKNITDNGGNTLTAGYVAHSWNAVMINNLWYAVDVTWNDTSGNLKKYLLVGDDFLSETHVADGVISSSGFELKYPALRPLSYGVDKDKGGFVFKDSGKIGDNEFGYIKVNDDNGGEIYSLTLGVSFNGKNVVELRNDIKYFSVRYFSEDSWTNWYSIPGMNDAMFEDADDVAEYEKGMTANEYTVQYFDSTAKIVQFAVFECQPSTGFTYTDREADEHIISVSTTYANNAYNKGLRAPYVKKITPSGTGYIKSLEPVNVSITYSEPLVYEDPDNETVDVVVSGKRTDIEKYAKIDKESIVWNEETNTLSFVFSPSRQYSHDCETYRFSPTNLIGKNSRRAPEEASLSFKIKSVVCPKVFNDGRLYMQVFGEPKFVSASDESLSDFKDNKGQPIVGDQRSQLMLVINNPTAAESEEMKDVAEEQFGLQDGDIVKSATYQIDLHLCGFLQKVPNGSFMQVGFGFPEGIDPSDAGVTFTVYHYTRDSAGKIKEVQAVPCVVTECGIVATVRSFSPFMICAVKSDKAVQAGKTAGRTVYAYVNGKGGSIKSDEIVTLTDGGNKQYDVVCEDGYTVDRITLNGVDIKNKYNATTKKLTLEYADLASESDEKYRGNSAVEITFISDRSAQYYATNNIEVAHPTVLVTEDDMIKASYSGVITAPADGGGNATGIVVGVCVSLIVVAAAVIVTCIVIRKKKATATADGKQVPRNNSEKAVKTEKTVATSEKTSVNKSANVAQPARPAQSARPAQPTRPTQPTRPVQPARPAQSARPAQPTRPAQSARPTGNNKPTDKK